MLPPFLFQQHTTYNRKNEPGCCLLAVLDGALSSDGDFAARVLFHLLLGEAARANDEADEVVVGILFEGNVDAQLQLLLHGPIVAGRHKLRADLERRLHQPVPLLRQLLRRHLQNHKHCLQTKHDTAKQDKTNNPNTTNMAQQNKTNMTQQN